MRHSYCTTFQTFSHSTFVFNPGIYNSRGVKSTNNDNNVIIIIVIIIPDVGRDSSQHSGRLIPACHVPLCQWRCWNCFGKEEIQIFCPSFRLSFSTYRLRKSGPTKWVGSWLPERGWSSLECLIPRSTWDLFPVSAAVSLDTALQLGAHFGVILTKIWTSSHRGYFVFSFLFLALGPYTPEGKKIIIIISYMRCQCVEGYQWCWCTNSEQMPDRIRKS